MQVTCQAGNSTCQRARQQQHNSRPTFKRRERKNPYSMEQLEVITAELLDKKFLFNGFGQGKLQWDTVTLTKVYQRLLSVYCDGFDYEHHEEHSSSQATQLQHICKCLRLLGISHLAPKTQDLVDKSRALRIISALDDKISAKYKSHMAARRIRVVIKKELRSKSARAKPRPPAAQEDSSQDVFPTVPLPKSCESQSTSASQETKREETKPIPKAKQSKKSQPKTRATQAVMSSPVTHESDKDFISSGRQLQRTPVATSEKTAAAAQSDSPARGPALPLPLELESDVLFESQPSTTHTDDAVHCKAGVHASPTPHLDREPCHSAATVFSSSVSPELDCNDVQSNMEKKEGVQSHSHREAVIPPVPFSSADLPAVPPHTDHNVDSEEKLLCEKKINIIPTGQQIPRTPGESEKDELCLEKGLCSSDKETAEASEVQDAALPSNLPHRYTEASEVQDAALPSNLPHRYTEGTISTESQEEVEVEKDTNHIGSIAPLSPVPSPPEPCQGLTMQGPAEVSGDHSWPPEVGTPVQCVLPPPSGYRDEDTASEALQEESSSFTSETTVSESPTLYLHPSPGDTFVQTNSPQEAEITYGNMSPIASVSMVKHDNQSTYSVRNSESPSTTVSNDENPFCGATFIAGSPTSIGSDTERTFINDKGVCEEPVDLEKLMESVSTDADPTYSKQIAVDKQKTLVSSEKDISELCENVELSGSLRESDSPGGSDYEISHTVQGTPPVQDTTYLVPLKPPGNRRQRETNMACGKDLDGTYVVPAKACLNETIGSSSKTDTTFVCQMKREEPVLNAPRVYNNTFISQIQNEELFSLSGSDDSLEIFPRKNKANRRKQLKASSDMITDTYEKLPAKVDEGEHGHCKESEGIDSEANIIMNDDLECTETKETFMRQKATRKKRMDKENYIDCYAQSHREKEISTENIADSENLDKDVKLVLKDSKRQTKRGRPTVKSKETSTATAVEDKEEKTRNKQTNKPKGATVKVCRKMSKRNVSHSSATSDKEKGILKQRTYDALNSKDTDPKMTVECDDGMEGKVDDVTRKTVKPKGRPKKSRVVSVEAVVEKCDTIPEDNFAVERREIKSRGSTMNSGQERSESTMNSGQERSESTMNSGQERSESTMNSGQERSESTMNSGQERSESTMNSGQEGSEMTVKKVNDGDEVFVTEKKDMKPKGRPRKRIQADDRKATEKCAGKGADEVFVTEKKDMKPKGRPRKLIQTDDGKATEKCAGKDGDEVFVTEKKDMKPKGRPRKRIQTDDGKATEKCAGKEKAGCDNVQIAAVKTKCYQRKHNQENKEIRIQKLDDILEDDHEKITKKTVRNRSHLKKNYKDTEMVIDEHDNTEIGKVKADVDGACGDQVTKSSENIAKRRGKKKEVEPPCTEPVRSRRACKVKALQAISEIMNDSLT